MPRSKNESELGICGKQLRPSLQQSSFFTVQSAARDNNSHIGREPLQQPRRVGFDGGANVELEISGNGDAIRLAAKVAQALGISLTLRKHS